MSRKPGTYFKYGEKTKMVSHRYPLSLYAAIKRKAKKEKMTITEYILKKLGFALDKDRKID